MLGVVLVALFWDSFDLASHGE